MALSVRAKWKTSMKLKFFEKMEANLPFLLCFPRKVQKTFGAIFLNLIHKKTPPCSTKPEPKRSLLLRIGQRG